MEAFRQFLKGPFGKLLLLIFLAPLAFLGIDSYFNSRVNPDTIATVDDVAVSQQEFNTALRDEVGALKARMGDAISINDEELKQQVFDSLIDKTVFELQAKKLGIQMSDAQIAQMVKSDPSFSDESGNFSQEKFDILLRNNGLSQAQLFSRIRSQMAVSQLAGGIAQTAFMPTSAADKVINLQSQARHVWSARVDAQPFYAAAKVTEAQVQTYYDKHKDELTTKELVDLSYIVLPAAKFANVSVSEQELAAAYSAYRTEAMKSAQLFASHILFTGDDAHKRAQEVLTRLQAGEDFAILAKQLSQDPDSKDRGGSLGEIGLGAFGDAFDNTIIQLNKGEISNVVDTNFGSHIIRLDDITGEPIAAFAEKRTELLTALQAQKQTIPFQDAISRIDEKSVQGQSIEDIAAAEGLTVGHVKNYSHKANPATLPDVLLAHPDVEKQVFDTYNVQNQAVSTAITPWADKAVWVQSSNHREVRKQTLAEAKLVIIQRLKHEYAMQQAKAKAQNIAKAVNAAHDVAAAQGLGVSFSDLGSVTRMLPVLSESQMTAVFSQLSTGEVVAGVDADDTGYTVLAVKPEANEASIPEQVKANLKARFTEVQGQQQLMDYLHYAKGKHKITRNDDALNQPQTAY